MEDDVGTVVEVMQVVATVEASVTEDVLQHQLLETRQRTHQQRFRLKSHVSGLRGGPRTDLHHFLLLGHVVLQQFVRQRGSSAHRGPEREQVWEQFRQHQEQSELLLKWL